MLFVCEQMILRSSYKIKTQEWPKRKNQANNMGMAVRFC